MVVRAAKYDADQASRLTNSPRYCAALKMPQSTSRCQDELAPEDQRLCHKGIELEYGETLEGVVHFTDGLGNSSLAVRVEQRAEAIGEERFGQDNTAWMHRSRPLESPCQFEDRPPTAPHCRGLDDGCRDDLARPAAVDVVDYLAKTAGDPLPSTGIDQLAGSQCERCARFVRLARHDPAVELCSGHEDPHPECQGSVG